ncbi:MAG: class I tRNA ligase family protein, partial [Candidatus Harrisonbacteria bacterium]|nr:class I tRNA ligase family protein [Candidatus Harrisonbacteria bacterium]
MERSADVLDTWFSSALWPFAGLNDADKKQFYPSNVLITARDIINLWVGRMIFSGIEFMGKTPFPDVLIHGTILTKDGKRMSKSLGTGIDPLQYIAQYGADATRFGIIWQTMGNQDIRWDEAAVLAGRKFANKIWNASRFVLGRIGNASTSSANNYSLSGAVAKSKGYLDAPKPKTSADKQVLKRLVATKKSLEKSIAAYKLGPALHGLYDFFWHDFCDIYLEASKAQQDENTNVLLLHALTASLKMLHPFMPHITEEIYQRLPIANREWLIVEEW